jgi:transposase
MSKKQSSVRAEAQQLFYTEEFKLKIVDEVLSGKLNRHQASKLYGIRGNATITYWIRQMEGLPGKGGITSDEISNFSSMKQNIKDKKLEEENKELRELLRVAELRADVWQRAVEIAEKEFEIEIIKKYGAQALRQLEQKTQKPK